jgi:hypothetical protein
VALRFAQVLPDWASTLRNRHQGVMQTAVQRPLARMKGAVQGDTLRVTSVATVTGTSPVDPMLNDV